MKPLEQIYGSISSLTLSSNEKPTKVLVLLHGVGSNEKNLLEIAPLLSDDRMVVSMRAPIAMVPSAFAWFHVQFTEQGPIHNWNEAKHSLKLIEDALLDLSEKTGIPLNKISIFGFSQGAIMTLGLALTSKLNLENYIASSGRTLPEFATSSREQPLSSYSLRRVYVTHGIQDSKLPILMGRNTNQILKSTALQLTYKEYPSDHTISQDVLVDVKKWLSSK
jgi:phospholipase/carboxylesterase